MQQPQNNTPLGCNLVLFNVFALVLLATGLANSNALFTIGGGIALAVGLYNTVKWANLPRDEDKK
jgi:hypothetical protein